MLYLIGVPGSGKSTLAAGLTEGRDSHPVERPFAHTIWTCSYEPHPAVFELGARRSAFSGTDALSMSVQPKVLAWLKAERPAVVLAEGDRLGNQKFFAAVLGLGYQLDIIHLTVSATIADYRRTVRAAELGATLQNEQWLRGRISKVRNLAAAFAPHVLAIDADQSAAPVLAQVRGFADVCPVIAALTSP